MKHKIALIVPIYGRLPNYFKFFIESLKNKPVKVLIFSDQLKPDNLPINSQWVAFSFEELIAKIEYTVCKKINIKNGYKLCDYKPMFGEIFYDYLKDFDFWGNIDPDVIMGNFEIFINDKILEDIDVYSGIREYLSGSFFLLRNNKEINQLWRKCKDLNIIFSSSEYKLFDEVGGQIWQELKAGKNILNFKTDIQSFTELIILESKNGLRLNFQDTTLEPSGFYPIYFNRSGEIYYKGEHFMLLHLLYFKTKHFFKVPDKLIEFSYINSFGFFNFNPLSYRFIFSYNFINSILSKIKIQINKLHRF
jgi:hypothetical protein